MSFKVFIDEDKLENVVSTIAEPMWTDGTATLTTFFTGSVQDSNNGKYYYDVHNTAQAEAEAEKAGKRSLWSSVGGILGGIAIPMMLGPAGWVAAAAMQEEALTLEVELADN